MLLDSDICGNRHSGDVFSHAAYLRFVETLPERRRAVFEFIRSRGSDGATCAEAAAHFQAGMNAISGRFTELKAGGVIVPSRTQLWRSGPNGGRGGVYVAQEFL